MESVRWNIAVSPDTDQSVRMFIAAQPETADLNDPNDAFLLAMAVVGEAGYLVTGDCPAGLLQRGSVGRTRLLTPAGFCVEVR